MKRRHPLVAIGHRRPAIWFVGFLFVELIACALAAQVQAPVKQNAASSSQDETQAASNTPKNRFPKGGVWHHFGESNKVSVAGQGQTGVWRRLGANDDTGKLSPNASVPKPNLDLNRVANLERQMWVLVNRDRLKPETLAKTRGLAQPLNWNENLAAVARAHSRNMLEQGFFDHVEPDGTTLSTRINEAGIPWRMSGENIAIYETVKGAEAAFMNEPRFQHNHRANILNASYTDVGIGIVQGPNGSLYITQDFVAVPPKARPGTSHELFNLDNGGGRSAGVWPAPTSETPALW